MSSIGAGSFHSSALAKYQEAVPGAEYANPQDLVEGVYSRTQEEEEKIAENDALACLDRAIGSGDPSEKRKSVLDLKDFFENKVARNSAELSSSGPPSRASLYDQPAEEGILKTVRTIRDSWMNIDQGNIEPLKLKTCHQPENGWRKGSQSNRTFMHVRKIFEEASQAP